MIDAIVRLSVDRRYFMLSLILVLIGVGVWSFQRLPIDAVPDITNVQVQINTQAPGVDSRGNQEWIASEDVFSRSE